MPLPLVTLVLTATATIDEPSFVTCRLLTPVHFIRLTFHSFFQLTSLNTAFFDLLQRDNEQGNEKVLKGESKYVALNLNKNLFRSQSLDQKVLALSNDLLLIDTLLIILNYLI